MPFTPITLADTFNSWKDKINQLGIDVDSAASNYVTIAGDQNVSGAKSFLGRVVLPNATSSGSSFLIGDFSLHRSGLGVLSLGGSISCTGTSIFGGISATSVSANSTTISGLNTSSTILVNGGNQIAAVNTTSTPIQIGATTTSNLVLDSDDIQSRNNSAADTLNLNRFGGNVHLFGQSGISGNLIVGNASGSATNNVTFLNSNSGVVFSDGSSFTSAQQSDFLRLTSTNFLSLSSTNSALQVGATALANIVFDGAAIQGRFAGVANAISINGIGGTIRAFNGVNVGGNLELGLPVSTTTPNHIRLRSPNSYIEWPDGSTQRRTAAFRKIGELTYTGPGNYTMDWQTLYGSAMPTVVKLYMRLTVNQGPSGEAGVQTSAGDRYDLNGSLDTWISVLIRPGSRTVSVRMRGQHPAFYVTTGQLVRVFANQGVIEFWAQFD